MNDEAEDADAVARALRVVLRIEPLLAGHGHAVQGAVLAELTAAWACGFQTSTDERISIAREHYRQVTDMIAAMSRNR